MALDGIVISHLTLEIANKIINKKISKIYQYNNDNIIISFKDETLLLSANATYPRMYLINNLPEADEKQSNFMQNLRRYLTGAIVIDISQVGLDRIVNITFLALNDFKERVTLHLIVEIMGKYSNIILTDDENNIIDSNIHVTSFISSKRTIMPKGKYERVNEENKYDVTTYINGLDSEKEIFIKKLLSLRESDEGKKMSPSTFLTKTFYGVSKVLVDSFISKNNIKDEETYDKNFFIKFINYINDLINLENDKLSMKIYYKKDVPSDFHIIDIENSEYDKSISCSSMSEMIADFYDKKARANNIHQKSSDIKIILNNAMNKAKKKKMIHTTNIDEAKDAEIYKVYGDLIFSNIYLIKQGMDKITLNNFYDDNNEVTITLDENLTPSENANKYYKKYNKAKSTLKNSIMQLKEIDEEIVYLETVLSYLDNALSFEDINNIKEELQSMNYIKQTNNKGKKKKEESKPHKFISTDGFEIYVGKNNIQNDEITFKIAKDSDVWLHVQDIPGSHVIIKTNGKGLDSVPETTLFEAANLGVFFSKGRESTKVPIDYTERRYVRKPSGAKPGFVIFLNNKTLYITPSKEVLEPFKINY